MHVSAPRLPGQIEVGFPSDVTVRFQPDRWHGADRVPRVVGHATVGARQRAGRLGRRWVLAVDESDEQTARHGAGEARTVVLRARPVRTRGGHVPCIDR